MSAAMAMDEIKSSSTDPIGIFDSGMGGISVTRQIHADMPYENLIFFGDSANAPYGTRSTSEVRDLSFAVADRLVNQGVKAIVVACNTATSACVTDMREHYSIPIIGMEPALKVACDRGNGVPQNIIVTATELTLREKKFSRLMARFQNEHTIYSQPCPDLVTIVESGSLDNEHMTTKAIQRYLAPYDLDEIDSIVLGCTHFVFYRDLFRKLTPPTVELIDGNAGTSHHLQVVLESLGKLAPTQETSNEDITPRLGTVRIGNSSTDPRMIELSQNLLNRPIQE